MVEAVDATHHIDVTFGVDGVGHIGEAFCGCGVGGEAGVWDEFAVGGYEVGSGFYRGVLFYGNLVGVDDAFVEVAVALAFFEQESAAGYAVFEWYGADGYGAVFEDDTGCSGFEWLEDDFEGEVGEGEVDEWFHKPFELGEGVDGDVGSAAEHSH